MSPTSARASLRVSSLRKPAKPQPAPSNVFAARRHYLASKAAARRSIRLHGRWVSATWSACAGYVFGSMANRHRPCAAGPRRTSVTAGMQDTSMGKWITDVMISGVLYAEKIGWSGTQIGLQKACQEYCFEFWEVADRASAVWGRAAKSPPNPTTVPERIGLVHPWITFGYDGRAMTCCSPRCFRTDTHRSSQRLSPKRPLTTDRNGSESVICSDASGQEYFQRGNMLLPFALLKGVRQDTQPTDGSVPRPLFRNGPKPACRSAT